MRGLIKRSRDRGQAEWEGIVKADGSVPIPLALGIILHRL